MHFRNALQINDLIECMNNEFITFFFLITDLITPRLSGNEMKFWICFSLFSYL